MSTQNKLPKKDKRNPKSTMILVLLFFAVLAFFGAQQFKVFPFEEEYNSLAELPSPPEKLNPPLPAKTITKSPKEKALKQSGIPQENFNRKIEFKFGSNLLGVLDTQEGRDAFAAYKNAIDPNSEWAIFSLDKMFENRAEQNKYVASGGIFGINYLKFSADVGFGNLPDIYFVKLNPEYMTPLLEQRGLYRGKNKIGDSCHMSISVYARKISDQMPLIQPRQLMGYKIDLYSPESTNGALIRDFLKRHELLDQGYNGKADYAENIKALREKEADYIITTSRVFKTEKEGDAEDKEEKMTIVDSFFPEQDFAQVLHEEYKDLPCYAIFSKAQLPEQFQNKIIEALQGFQYGGSSYLPIPAAKRDYMKQIFLNAAETKIRYNRASKEKE